jgi:hypothetical protein
MQTVEIQDHARKLFESNGQNGQKAISEAATKAKTFEDQGRKDDAQDWRRIETALKQMQQAPRAS